MFAQTVVNHIVVWGSIIFTFVFNYIYCAIDTQQRLMDTLYVMQRASSRAEFWFVLVITPIIALLPRYGRQLDVIDSSIIALIL